MSWPWQRGGENKQSEQIAALERRLDTQESQQRLIKVEWESVLDKVNSVMGRLNARIRKFESNATTEDGPGEQPEQPAGVTPLGTHSTLAQMRGRRRGVLSG